MLVQSGTYIVRYDSMTTWDMTLTLTNPPKIQDKKLRLKLNFPVF